MHVTIYSLILAFLTGPSAIAQTTQLKLLNPDGTPAVDARAIAIMVPFTRVDANLNELPSLDMEMPEGGGTRAIKNEAGAIAFDSKALAVVAQNQAGFAFIPLPLKSNSVKLRPWAKLEIDPSAIALRLSDSQHVAVLWENCFVGHPLRPSINTVANDDPFESSAPAPFDWRFDSLVTWSLSLTSASDQVVNVPPGELTLMISDKDTASVDLRKPVPFVRFNPLRTLSGKQVTPTSLEFRAIQGKLVDEANLPDWNLGGDNELFVYAMPGGAEEMPDEYEQLFMALDGKQGILDELVRRYASETGTRYRYGRLPTAMARVSEEGTFQFSHLPVGKYQLSLFLRAGGVAPLKRQGDVDEKSLVVELTLTASSSRLDIGEVERAYPPHQFYPPTQKVPQTDPFGSPVADTSRADPYAGNAAMNDPFGSGEPAPAKSSAFAPKRTNSVEAAEQRIKYALAKRAEELDFQGEPLNQVIETLQDTHGIPIRLSQWKLAEVSVALDTPVTIILPPVTLQSALRHILSTVSDELSFTIRDEVLLITSKADAAREEAGQQPPPALFSSNLTPATPTELDTGADFVKQWLKTANNASDQRALRNALQAHLEQEFEANQAARRAELTRLQELLKQSDTWLDARQTRREEIVGQRLNELLPLLPGKSKE